ncbi:MAG: DUF4363 family protein [Christensenellales bacterium]
MNKKGKNKIFKKAVVSPRTVVFWFFALILTAIFIISDIAVKRQAGRIHSLCDEIIILSSEKRFHESSEAAARLGEEWKKAKVWWGFLFEHIETDNIELNVDQVIAHVNAKRADFIEEYATLLKSQMEHIQEIEGFCLKSLI